jgi:hypothetical protein
MGNCDVDVYLLVVVVGHLLAIGDTRARALANCLVDLYSFPNPRYRV